MSRRLNGLPGSMIPTTISPSVAKQAAFYGRQIQIGPRGLLGNLNPHWIPLLPASGSAVTNEHRELVQVEVNNTNNQFTNSGTPDMNGQPLATVESGAGNRPVNKTAYSRFNGKEQKERDAIAENWIQAEVKKRMWSNRRASAPNPESVKPDTLLFEYAMYTKDHSFINAIRKAVAGMIVRQRTFTCCSRGTSGGGLPTSEADLSSLSVQASPVQTAQEVIQKILGDYLQVSKVDNDMIESVMECTFAETNGLFADFISDVEQKVFNKHEDLPAYEWDIPAKVKIMQKYPRFKSTLCS